MTQRGVGATVMVLGGVLVLVAVVGALRGDDGAGTPAVAGDTTVATQEPSPTPADASPSTDDPSPSGVATAPDETDAAEARAGVEDFLARFVAAFREDDRTFLVARLHPAVTERYGEDRCRTYLGEVADPEFDLTVREVGEPESWEWVSDGITTRIEDAIPVEVERMVQSQTVIQELHLAAVDGEIRWFTDCGEPRGGQETNG